MNHTPGPWKMTYDAVDNRIVTDEDGKLVASVPSSLDNARLIAAAPALLAFAKMIFELFNLCTDWGPGGQEVADDAAKVIAKATGEQP